MARIPQARALPDPKFSYARYIREVETRVGPQQHRVSLSQTFPGFGKLRAATDVRIAEALVAEKRFEEEKYRLMVRVGTAWFAYYYLFRELKLTQEHVHLLQDMEHVARARFRSGGTLTSIVQLEMEVARLQERIQSLEEQKAVLLAALNAVLNRSSQATVKLPEKADPIELFKKNPATWEKVKASNAELATLQKEYESAQKSIAVAQRRIWPDITVGLEFIQTDKAKGDPEQLKLLQDNGKDPVIASLSFNLPLHVPKYRAYVQEAKAQSDAAFEKMHAYKNELQAECCDLHFQWHDAERRNTLFQHTLMPKAQEVLEITLQAFETGEVNFLDLIEAQRTLLDFELSYERAMTDAQLAQIKLAALMGGDAISECFSDHEQVPIVTGDAYAP